VKKLINSLEFVDDEWMDGWMDGWMDHHALPIQS